MLLGGEAAAAFWVRIPGTGGRGEGWACQPEGVSDAGGEGKKACPEVPCLCWTLTLALHCGRVVKLKSRSAASGGGRLRRRTPTRQPKPASCPAPPGVHHQHALKAQPAGGVQALQFVEEQHPGQGTGGLEAGAQRETQHVHDPGQALGGVVWVPGVGSWRWQLRNGVGAKARGHSTRQRAVREMRQAGG